LKKRIKDKDKPLKLHIVKEKLYLERIWRWKFCTKRFRISKLKFLFSSFLL
jgi:hypothetical protein